jgi:peptide/nickel transport system permease protein
MIVSGQRGSKKIAGRLRAAVPPSFWIGCSLLLVFVVIAATASLWAPYGYATIVSIPLLPPSGHYLLGTDLLGRDVFSRVMDGTAPVLALSLGSTAISTLAGGLLGLALALTRGTVDAIVMRVFEVLISIPFLILGLVLIAAVGVSNGGGSWLLVGVVVLIYLPRTAQVVRSAGLSLVESDFVAAARARGERRRSIVVRELLPNITGVALVEFGVRAGYAPILVSSLAFLGFGAQPPSPQWGVMISENRSTFATGNVWAVLGPALALGLLVIAINFVTDGLARVLDRSTVRVP